MTSGSVLVDDSGYGDMWRMNAGYDVCVFACESVCWLMVVLENWHVQAGKIAKWCGAGVQHWVQAYVTFESRSGSSGGMMFAWLLVGSGIVTAVARVVGMVCRDVVCTKAVTALRICRRLDSCWSCTDCRAVTSWSILCDCRRAKACESATVRRAEASCS